MNQFMTLVDQILYIGFYILFCLLSRESLCYTYTQKGMHSMPHARGQKECTEVGQHVYSDVHVLVLRDISIDKRHAHDAVVWQMVLLVEHFQIDILSTIQLGDAICQGIGASGQLDKVVVVIICGVASALEPIRICGRVDASSVHVVPDKDDVHGVGQRPRVLNLLDAISACFARGHKPLDVASPLAIKVTTATIVDDCQAAWITLLHSVLLWEATWDEGEVTPLCVVVSGIKCDDLKRQSCRRIKWAPPQGVADVVGLIRHRCLWLHLTLATIVISAMAASQAA